jgi:hypothetical protein
VTSTTPATSSRPITTSATYSAHFHSGVTATISLSEARPFIALEAVTA